MKICISSSITLAFFVLLLSSLYQTLSIVSLLSKLDSIYPTASRSKAYHEPHPTKKDVQENNLKAGIYFTGLMKASKFDLTIGRNIDDERFVDPIVAETIQTHLTRMMSNTTIQNNEFGNGTLSKIDNSQTEQRRVLETLISYYSEKSPRIHSDIVELRHCRLELLDYSRFSRWAAVILLDAWSKLEVKLKRNGEEAKGLSRKDDWDDVMYQEFCLGLLEIFATHSKGKGNATICDFRNYPLTIQRSDGLVAAESILRNVPISSNGLPRLVFVIVAFQDSRHLEALIEACFMPHHLIIVHLERRSPNSFTESVRKIANKYANVAVVQFGSIIYQTDSVSTVNYQIMNWLNNDLKIPYDYLLTLGNAAYPLYGAEELTNYFKTTQRDIWLGELRNNMNGGWISWAYLERKRLIFTAGDQKYTQRTKKWKQNGFDSPIPDYIKTNMTAKTNSGNQAVYSYGVVKKLIESPEVKELISMAKYGCCCCLEERTWIAAAQMIGYGKEALEAASMFQVWGGEPSCGDGSMKNALLRPNATICYKSEDVTKGSVSERQRKNSVGTDTVENSYFRGNKLLEELRMAKKRGFLFARKFSSGDQSSLKLLELIRKNIHKN